MPSWVSDKGIWKPAKEKAYVPPDAGKGREEGYIYEGPDRQSQAYLNSEKVDHLGMDCRTDPEVIYRARQSGMTVEEWLKLNEPPAPETVKAEEAKKKYVQTHKPEKAKPGVNPQGGRAPGRPESEGGSFGDAPTGVAPVQS
jgi:hypothetical protein